MVLAAKGRKANDSHADCYQYFCVPEYGTANGRLHFHAVHFMRTLPTGSVDPNFGRRVRDRKSGSAGMPRPISYAVFCLKKKKAVLTDVAGPVGTTEPTAAPVHGRLAVRDFAGQYIAPDA